MLQDLEFGGPGLPLEDILLLLHHVPGVSLPEDRGGAARTQVQRGARGHRGPPACQRRLGREPDDGGPAPRRACLHSDRDGRGLCRDPSAVRGGQPRPPAPARPLAPVLAFSNQHLDVSIRFFKHLRQREGLFTTAHCRPGVRALDTHQMRELEACIDLVLALTHDLPPT
jgi:hypothetical protein